MEQSDITQRLRKLATRLLDAYEAMALPQTFSDADRAAKALISIGKAIALTGDEVSKSKPVTEQVVNAQIVSARSAVSPRKPSTAASYADIERQAKALMKANRSLRRGTLSDGELDALLGPPD